MNEARKKVIKAQAYEHAYEGIERRIEAELSNIEWREQDIKLKKENDEEYKPTYEIEEIENSKAIIEIYKQVQKEILK